MTSPQTTVPPEVQEWLVKATAERLLTISVAGHLLKKDDEIRRLKARVDELEREVESWQQDEIERSERD